MQKAVLLMGYCSIASIDELPAFYSHLFHGRLPAESVMSEAAERYRRLGTVDPLGAITARQARALERRLELRYGEKIAVYTAFKHTSPFIGEAVERIVSDGVAHLFALPMTPFYSKTGTGAYLRSVKEAKKMMQAGLEITDIAHWHQHPDYVSVVADRLNAALNWLSQAGRSRAVVLFTAHSKPGLPSANRDYIRAFTELAEAVAERSNCSSWKLGYRSGGPAPQTWLAPDVIGMIEEAAADGAAAVVVCDLLTVTENVEVVYDCGHDCSVKARELGMEFVSVQYPNDSDDFMTALEHIVADAIDASRIQA